MKRISVMITVVLAIAFAILISPTTKADVVILTNGNSTATIDTGSQAGMSNWTIDELDTLQKQWFWYRVGATGGERSIDTLTPTLIGESDVDFDGFSETLLVRYVNTITPFELSVRIQLTGGQPDDGNAGITEVISISNTGTTPLDYHFFQYSDSNLDPSNPSSDTVVYPFPNEVQQSNPNSSSFDCGVVPLPTHSQADLVSNAPTNALTLLTDASPTTLNDVAGPLTGNAAWANQWDVTIQPGDTFQVSVNKKTNVSHPVGPGSICVHKFYDANADSIDNDGKSVRDLRFTLSGVDGSGNCITKKGYTDDNGNICFTNLPPGKYCISETVPCSANWLATTAAKICTNLVMGQNISLSFGNLCMGDGEAAHKSSWCKSSGQTVLTTNDFTALTALCLRNSDGSNRDFTGTLSANKSDYNNWVRGQSNRNMAYSLSVELATMVLSVRQGYITNSANQIVYAPGCGNRGIANNFISIDDLITAANNALCADGYTPCNDANRTLQQCLNDALDNANNNEGFVQPEPCCTYCGSNHGSQCDRNDGDHDYDRSGKRRHHDDRSQDRDREAGCGWGWR